MLNSLKIGRIPPTGRACGFPPTKSYEELAEYLDLADEELEPMMKKLDLMLY